MRMLSNRLQLLVTPDQRRRLEAEARQRGVSVASLIREAIDAHFGAVTQDDRLRALDEIRAGFTAIPRRGLRNPTNVLRELKLHDEIHSQERW